MKNIFAALILVLALSVTNAAAELKSANPSEVCSYMAGFGLNTRGWKNQYDNIFGCSSAYKEIGAGFPLANNLAFYAEGNRNTVKQVKLVLNVNNKSASASAHAELLKASDALSMKASGKTLPQALKESIKSGKSGSGKVGASTVEIVRINWPTGKGYEVKVFIE